MFRSTCLGICFIAVIFSQANAGLLGNARIIDGGAAGTRRYYEVLVIGDNNNCTGALINPKWVVTSAQCAKSVGYSGYIQVAYGAVTFDPATDYHWINQAFVHPAYNPSTLANDIALLELLGPANGNVQMCTLPKTPQASYENERPTVSGWGASSNYGPAEANLLEKVVPIVDNSQCAKSGYPVPKGPIICARGRSVCEFDQGAPLVKGRMLIGIATGNNDLLLCGSMTYSTFTNVGYYVTWLRQTTKLTLI